MTSSQVSQFIVSNCISVEAAARYSGFSLLYLRRLLRNGQLSGLKVGQVWLIDAAAFEGYFSKARESSDLRVGPR